MPSKLNTKRSITKAAAGILITQLMMFVAAFLIAWRGLDDSVLQPNVRFFSDDEYLIVIKVLFIGAVLLFFCRWFAKELQTRNIYPIAMFILMYVALIGLAEFLNRIAKHGAYEVANYNWVTWGIVSFNEPFVASFLFLSIYYLYGFVGKRGRA